MESFIQNFFSCGGSGDSSVCIGTMYITLDLRAVGTITLDLRADSNKGHEKRTVIRDKVQGHHSNTIGTI